ncbi:MAG: hypothetical protein OEY59_12190 [Deltaproteobacteria bacterium]|nr:hypothetical protein [Deltaproteobacteria bacterium]
MFFFERKKDSSPQTIAFQLRSQILKEKAETINSSGKKIELIKKAIPYMSSKRLNYSDRFSLGFVRDVLLICSPAEETFSLGSRNQEFENSHFELLKLRVGKSAAQGVFQNLDEIIRKVQAIWFPEMIDPPRVRWLKRFSTRKLAHFSPDKDEIAFSLIFDMLETPVEILYYLAYHELLHREIGVEKIQGRRRAHTPRFKEMEKRFPDFQEMENKINRYITTFQITQPMKYYRAR